MKRIFLFVLVSIVAMQVFAQQPVSVLNPYPRTINVTGSAEMEIVPDRIYVNITLQEYKNKSEKKKEIDDIKAQFLASLKKAGIEDSMVSIASYGGENSYYHNRRKKRDTDLMAAITYQVRFSNSADMDRVIDGLDDEATLSFDIVLATHSRIQEIRKQLKIDAVKASKEKAGYLATAVGATVGDVVTISEPTEWNPMMRYSQMSMTSNSSSSIGSEATTVDFKKMKLRFEVTAVFELK